MRTHSRLLVLCAVLAGAACGSTPTPPTPTPDAPTLTCPSSVTVQSPDGAAMAVPFTVPTAVGGQPPVPVTCSRLSGSLFPLGSTIVTCSATDALSRQASCNFAVTVNAAARISKTRFLAFGDSITLGRCGPRPGECPPYTVRLAELLRERYVLQSFVVTARGVSGETAPQGEDRLPGELAIHNPEVLLLMEGTNDMTAGAPDVPEALESLEDMIDAARARGVQVFLATIPPIAPGGPNNSSIPQIAPFNAQIKLLAARKNVPLVDVYAALNANIARYYVGDDLHPTGEGLRLIGETFFSVIKATLDITPTATSSSQDLLTPPAASRPVSRRPIRRR